MTASGGVERVMGGRAGEVGEGLHEREQIGERLPHCRFESGGGRRVERGEWGWTDTECASAG